VNLIPQMQTNNRTFFGRHWHEYQVLRRYKPSDFNLSILSFGCSTGAELKTLRAAFPAARIFGCDMDWANLLAARSLVGADAVVFESSVSELERHGPFDIIICNSVLLAPTRALADGSHRGIEPALWADVVSSLDAVLKPGGIIQIVNSNIPFRYHPLATNYRPLRSNLLFSTNFVDQYDPYNQKLASGVGGTGWSAILTRHLKASHSHHLAAGDLDDVHFWKADGPLPPDVHHESIPNLLENGVWAEGTMTYRQIVPPDERANSTFTEVDVRWIAVAIDIVRLERTVRRVWFEGDVASTTRSTVEMIGPEATALIESAQGRRSTALSIDAVMRPQMSRSSQFFG
jgi:SAM-dependent methyltransferase